MAQHLTEIEHRAVAVLSAPELPGSALCAQTDPELFFPDKGGSVLAAKTICHGCEVNAECLQWALDHGERWGVWGGLSAFERRKLGGAA
jgi:WhiB family transcriptional regulator, redox-sensing transcriptional regulator